MNCSGRSCDQEYRGTLGATTRTSTLSIRMAVQPRTSEERPVRRSLESVLANERVAPVAPDRQDSLPTGPPVEEEIYERASAKSNAKEPLGPLTPGPGRGTPGARARRSGRRPGPGPRARRRRRAPGPRRRPAHAGPAA